MVGEDVKLHTPPDGSPWHGRTRAGTANVAETVRFYRSADEGRVDKMVRRVTSHHLCLSVETRERTVGAVAGQGITMNARPTSTKRAGLDAGGAKQPEHKAGGAPTFSAHDPEVRPDRFWSEQE